MAWLGTWKMTSPYCAPPRPASVKSCSGRHVHARAQARAGAPRVFANHHKCIYIVRCCHGGMGHVVHGGEGGGRTWTRLNMMPSWKTPCPMMLRHRRGLISGSSPAAVEPTVISWLADITSDQCRADLQVAYHDPRNGILMDAAWQTVTASIQRRAHNMGRQAVQKKAL